MELPHLGRNCALSQCNQLDFLPVKCDACSGIFCLRHYQYDAHNCEKAKSRDVQVPACPLCSEPVVCRNKQSPDVAVSQHMDTSCRRNDMIKKPLDKPKTNLQSCTFKSCRQKDLIYLECRDCQSKFCIKHRHPTDHQCPGPSQMAQWQSFKGSCSKSATSGFEMLKSKAHQVSKSGQAALNRIAGTGGGSGRNISGPAGNSTNREPANFNVLQGNLNEQEALAIALSESRKNTTTTTVNGRQQTSAASSQQQEEEDLALARALHNSQLESSARSRGTSNASATNNKDTCILS